MLNFLKSPWGASFQSIRRLMTPRRAAMPPTSTPARSRDVQARVDERLRLRLMRGDLFALLQQHADSRRLMRHLGLVERTLRKKGWAAVELLPTAVIAKALAQLEMLVRDWSSEGLAEMRSRMAVLLRTRPADPVDDGIPELAPLERGLITSDDADIGDAHRAAFEEMERSWAGRVPDDSRRPATGG